MSDTDPRAGRESADADGPGGPTDPNEPGGSDESGESGRLIDLYRRYVGDPDRRSDVYAGFGLFFAGIALFAVGIVTFLWSATLSPDDRYTYAVREVAAVASAVGLPALLSGVVVLLPVDRRTVSAAGGGSAVCLAGVGVFVRAYPDNWNWVSPVDYTAEGVAVYSLGLVVVIAATGAALVAHQVERASGFGSGSGSGPGAAGGPTAGSDSPADAGPAVTDEQVESDIREALDSTEITWGGVEKRETRRLDLDMGPLEDDEAAEMSGTGGTTARSSGEGVDEAVSGLRNLKGSQPETATSDADVDDQTAALRELRERQRAEALAEDDRELTERLRDRVRDLL
jgi:hypothetical protein